jgi:hypothetical protein
MSAEEIQGQIDQIVIDTYKRIEKQLDSALDQCSKSIVRAGKNFAFSKNATLQKQIKTTLNDFTSVATGTLKSAIGVSWGLSNTNYDELLDNYLGAKVIPNPLKKEMFNHNTKALEAFANRAVQGADISTRIWKVAQIAQNELGLLMEEGLAVGKSAAELSRDVRSILKEPNKLFRRVKDENGNLQLSTAAKNYHPGQGVYRSAYQNALRLTGSEINIAYETAQYTRHQKLGFVTGIEVKLSNNHPQADICDALKGQYPKAFQFKKWHPRCRCHSVPILLNQDELMDYLDTGKVPESKIIKDIPKRAASYVENNRDMFNRLKSEPYFLSDNKQFFNGTNAIPSQVVKFAEAKSIKEAENWAMENLNIKFVSYKGIDLQVANNVNESVFKIKQLMPEIQTNGIGSAQEANKALKAELAEQFRKSPWYSKIKTDYGEQSAERQVTRFVNSKVERVGSKTVAWSTSNDKIFIPDVGWYDVSKYKGVFINNNYGKNAKLLNELIVKNEAQGWWVKGAGHSGDIISHEIGHEIDKTIKFRNTQVFKDIYTREHAKGIQSVIDNLSKYGATAGGYASHKPAEMIAEAWAEFIMSDAPRPLAKEIGEAMLKEYYTYYVEGTETTFNQWKDEILKIIK